MANEIPLHLRTASPDLDWKTRFRIIAAKASRNNKNPLSYSATEAPIRAGLVKMGFVEGESFLHQHRVFGYLGRKGQKVYYWLDFYLPDLKLGLEADGEVWHNFFDLKERDRNRDSILSKKQGVKVVRFSSYDLRKKRLERKLSRVIRRRAMEGCGRKKERGDVAGLPHASSTKRRKVNVVRRPKPRRGPLLYAKGETTTRGQHGVGNGKAS